MSFLPGCTICPDDATDIDPSFADHIIELIAEVIASQCREQRSADAELRQSGGHVCGGAARERAPARRNVVIILISQCPARMEKGGDDRHRTRNRPLHAVFPSDHPLPVDLR